MDEPVPQFASAPCAVFEFLPDGGTVETVSTLLIEGLRPLELNPDLQRAEVTVLAAESFPTLAAGLQVVLVLLPRKLLLFRALRITEPVEIAALHRVA